MAGQKQKQKQKKGGKQKQKAAPVVVVRAPTSVGVKGNTPRSGPVQFTQLLELQVTADQHVQTWDLLPCNLDWLSGVCQSYQRWKLSNIKIWYEPRVGTNTSGMLAMAVQSDYADATPTSLRKLITSAGAVRGPVWDKLTLQVPEGKARFYCSKTAFDAMGPSDKNDRSLGRLVTYLDFDTAVTAGYVYMSYTVQLLDPCDPSTQA